MQRARRAHADALTAVVALRVAKVVGAADEYRVARLVDCVDLAMLDFVADADALHALDALLEFELEKRPGYERRRDTGVDLF
jgi:uncharacterized radical SAM superfamily protein